jgi:hypothetical protein
MQIKVWIVIVLSLLLVSCATIPPPSHTQNLCSIFWRTATQNTERRWHVPVAVQMAIMYQESSFVCDAKPPRTLVLGFIPWTRPTTAYGYCQAVDPTWRVYQHQTGRYDTYRHNFADADEFVGWYASRAYKRAGIPPTNAYSLYLAYHEGITNYMHRSYLKKPWLMRVAQRVQARAKMYQSQLKRCWRRY